VFVAVHTPVGQRVAYGRYGVRVFALSLPDGIIRLRPRRRKVGGFMVCCAGLHIKKPVVRRPSAACTTAVAHQPSACKGRTIAGQKVCHTGLVERQKQGKGRRLSARWHTEKARREGEIKGRT